MQETMVVQPFAGSAYVAQHNLDFDQLMVLEGDKDAFTERTLEGQVRGVVLNLSSERHHYLMEEITTAAMEENTVTINEEMLNRQIEDAGSAVLYGIEFDTGTSVIRPSSIAALTGDYSIAPTRLQPGGVGPTAPVASNENDAGRQLNRRVELVRRLGE